MGDAKIVINGRSNPMLSILVAGNCIERNNCQVTSAARSEMTSLKMFCSVCLGFVEQEENKRENEFKIDKKIIETTLRRHFDDPSIKVGYYKNIRNYSR